MEYNLKNFLECGCSYCRKYKENMKAELREKLEEFHGFDSQLYELIKEILGE